MIAWMKLVSRALRAAVLVGLGLGLGRAADAAGTPGRFDFYVLSLSWAPSYCDAAADPDPAECGLGNVGLDVHGLWPEYWRGYPEFCRSDLRRGLEPGVLAGLGDILPSASLAQHEWEKHGICSGLDQAGYFALVRRALSKIAIPPALAAPRTDLRIAPADIEKAFLAANRGLTSGAIAVTCPGNRLGEVRVCLGRGTLDFIACDEVDSRACRAPSILVPAVR